MGHLIPPEPQWPGYDPSDFALRRDLPYLEEQREGAPGDLMNEPVEQEKPEKLKRSNWWWPGVVASSLAAAADPRGPGLRPAARRLSHCSPRRTCPPACR